MKFVLSLISVVGVAMADYKSGSVSTYEKFTYGKFVTRMKAPNQKGTVASFFTYWDGPGFYTGGWNELDMEIVPSVEKNPFSTNVIFGDGHQKQENHDYAHKFDPSDDWHVYAMEWTPDYISFAIDGDEVRHLSIDNVEAVEYISKAQSLRMNFWTPTFHSWGKGFDPVNMPWYAIYDYVETYTYNEHNNEFEFNWRDDFNDFDTSRWHKASGGFDSSSSVFYPSNVYTQAGNLVLKMEPLENDHHDYHHEGPAMHGLLHAHEPDQQKHRSSDHQVHRRSHHEEREDSIHGIITAQAPAHQEKMHPQRHEPSLHGTKAHQYTKEEVHQQKLQMHTEVPQEADHDLKHIVQDPEHDHSAPILHRPISHHETIQHGITHHEELQRDISAHHERHLTQHEPAIYFDSQYVDEPVLHHEPAYHKATLHVQEHPEEGVLTTHHDRLHQSVQHARQTHEQFHHEPQHLVPHLTEPIVSHYDPVVRAIPLHAEPIVQHRDVSYHIDHETHPKLDHAHDEQHDITPVPFHEHAVKKAFDHPDSHDYAHTTKELLPETRRYYQQQYDPLYSPHDYGMGERLRDLYPQTLVSPHLLSEHVYAPIMHQAHEDQGYWTSHEFPMQAEERHIAHHRQYLREQEHAPLPVDEEVTPFEHHHSYGHHYYHGDVHHMEEDEWNTDYQYKRHYEEPRHDYRRVQPHLVQPHLVQPHLVQPHLVQPHLVQPHLEQPLLVQPHLAQPHHVTSHEHYAAPHHEYSSLQFVKPHHEYRDQHQIEHDLALQKAIHHETPVIVERHETPVIVEHLETPVVVEHRETPVVIEHHETPVVVEHHEKLHLDVTRPYSHVTHPELDHKYDDSHDVTPVPFKEHAILKAVDRPESSSYEHLMPEQEVHDPVLHETVLHEVTHYEPIHDASLDLKYHGAPLPVEHQWEPEAGVHYADMHMDRHAGPVHGERGYDLGRMYPVHHPQTEQLTHEIKHYDQGRMYPVHYPHHRDEYHRIETRPYSHVTHPELDHKYDDAHDVTPVEFHEHAILKALPHPESQSYHPEDFGYKSEDHGHLSALGGDAYHYREHPHYYSDDQHHKINIDHEFQTAKHGPSYHVHEQDAGRDDYHHVPTAPIDFKIEEPMHEVSRHTFHGREEGYMYRDHSGEHRQPVGVHTQEPLYGVRHGETFGKEHKGDDAYEVVRQDFDDDNKHKEPERFIAPVFEHDEYEDVYNRHHVAGQKAPDMHFAPRQYHDREVEYEVDSAGHVHMYEAEPEYTKAALFLQ